MALSDILILVVLILLSGFSSGSEIALFSVGKLRINHLVKKKVRGAAQLALVREKPKELLITVLLINNIVNVGASSFATVIALSFFKENVIGIVTGIMTFLILTFGEITPKTLALRYNERISLKIAGLMSFLVKLFFPIVKFFDVLSGLLSGGSKKFATKPMVTEEELKSFIDVGKESGEIKEYEHKMLHRIFKFDQIDVKEIMTARPDMVMIKSTATVGDALKVFTKTSHSRLPVYQDHKDHIIGSLYIRDVMRRKPGVLIVKVMRKAYFVPYSKKIDSLLKGLQKRKQHMAIVVDEHGDVDGLVTTEDILEEIVGEIVDETEKIQPTVKRISKKSWRVLGRADVQEVNDAIKARFREDADFETISGFILKKLGHIPKKGDELGVGKYTITVEEVKGNRIELLKIAKK